MSNVQFKDLFWKFLTSSGLSQAEVARKLGRDRSTIFKWLSGENRPEEAKDVKKLSDILNLTEEQRRALFKATGHEDVLDLARSYKVYTFGELLKRYRNRSGISQSQLGECIHRNPSEIDQWEHGIHLPFREDILLLEAKLRLSQKEVDELLDAANFQRKYHVSIADATASAMAEEKIYGYLHLKRTEDKYYELKGAKLIIGRSPDKCNLVIPFKPDEQTYVSRVHATIYCEHDTVSIEDAQSTRGTFVDGERVTKRTLLRPGQHILLGDRSSRPEIAVLEFILDRLTD